VTTDRVSPARWIASASAAVLAAAVMVVGPAVLPAQFGIPTAKAACSDIEVVFARGTDEPPGIGRVGQAFVNSLRNQVGGRSIGVYAVDYPADYDFLAAANGANDASAHIQGTMNDCPATRIVLGGYSQGAAVIDVIAAVPFPAIGFNNPLPPDAPDHIAAVAVFGNPSTKLGLPITASPVYGPRSIDMCAGDDPVCSGGENIAAHSSYATNGMTGQAAGFVAGLV
jgi:cutinase